MIAFLKAIKTRMGTGQFNLLFSVFAIAFTMAAGAFGGNINIASLWGLFAAMLNNVALYMVIIFTLQYFQFGSQRDVNESIFKEGNVAAGVFQGCIVIGIAIVMSRAML